MMSTGVPIIDWFLALLSGWGYLIVFGFTVFENLFVVGSFTPGETVVIAAAAVASNEQLRLSLVWISSVLGTMLGSNTSYWLGRRAGMDSVRGLVERIAESRLGRILRIDVAGMDDVYDHFHTHGSKTVLVSRFAVGAKNFVPAIAGATHMPVFWFQLYTLLGAVIYTSLMCAIGWFLGSNLDRALRFASGVGYAGLLIFLIMLAAIVVAGRQVRRRRAARIQREEEFALEVAAAAGGAAAVATDVAVVARTEGDESAESEEPASEPNEPAEDPE